ncbi:hypothetical protein [Alkalibacterium sp. 20]|uniref:hypothetical protein n=1 Tax=Alkalibacterium sp. 20 TaxID=1798803 RepID=UPI00090015EE|nr:hypothetical protein [Alkalibacterium sp. 20]OJF91593.1 hypothetical protein AX762_03510 [Alkalibacterium sp. 20]
MPFVFVWLIQLFIFFAIVTSVASFLTKATKRVNTQANRTDPSKMDAPMHEVETTKRNEQKPAKTNNRPVREDRYTRTPRVRDTIREKNKSIIKDVVTIEDPYRAADKKVVTTLFNRKSLKQAVIYKEILDKPVSMRDE